MNSRQRFHFGAIITIVLTVTMVFLLSNKDDEKQEAVKVIGERFIMIYEASWGLNCNVFIQQTLDARRGITPTIVDGKPNYNDTHPADLALIRANNALMKLSDMCNTREKCTFKATPELFGDPYKSCNKELKISYRCFEFDRLNYLESSSSKDITIDCSAS